MAKATTAAAANGDNRTRKTTSWSDDPDRAQTSQRALEALEKTDPVKPAKSISLPTLDIRRFSIPLVGDSALICHRWSEKAKKQLLDKQMGVASEGREHKDPVQDYESSLYKLDGGGFGFPSIAFKSAAVTACTSLGKAVTKVQARQAFHVEGELIRIYGNPSMREDMVKIGMGTADIRYRGEFKQWLVVVNVRYNARVLSDQQIINLFNTAGFAVGVGEWRSERDGQFGLFHVGNDADMKRFGLDV